MVFQRVQDIVSGRQEASLIKAKVAFIQLSQKGGRRSVFRIERKEPRKALEGIAGLDQLQLELSHGLELSESLLQPLAR